MTMSEQAKSALINTRTAQGAPVQSSRAVFLELQDLGLVGEKGLTRKGSIEAMKAKRAAEDEAFGA